VSESLLSAVSAKAGSGHPIWHFGLVAGAAIAVFAGIKVAEWWRDSVRRPARPTPPIVALSLLGAASALIHAAVCPEHFREWVIFGIFFLVASALQAAWSVLVLIRPSERLLTVGAVGNAAVVILYVASRTSGIPLGPSAFRPEAVSTLGTLATFCEVAVCLGASWLVYDARQRRPMVTVTTGPGMIGVPMIAGLGRSGPSGTVSLSRPAESALVRLGGVSPIVTVTTERGL